MSPEDLQQLRYNVLTNVAKMPALLLNRNNQIPDYDSDIEHLNDLEIVIEQLETVFNMGKSTASMALGNEFQPAENSHDKVLAVPLYMYLDVMIAIITNAMNNTAKLDERKKSLLARLNYCREKASKIPYHPHFHSKKHLSKLAIDNIIQSKGLFNFSIIKADNKRYVSILSSVPQQRVNKNNQMVHVYREEVAFQEDYNRIKMRESERYINYVKKIESHIKRYFKNNMMPDTTKAFAISLKDPYLNNSIRMSLYSIIELLAHEATNESQITLDQAFKQLCKQEVEIAKKQMEEKARAFAQSALVEQNVKSHGVFERYRGVLIPKKGSGTTQEAINFFEEKRKNQIIKDEEKRSLYLKSNQIETIESKGVIR